MTQPELLFSHDLNLITQVDITYASTGEEVVDSINYSYTYSPLPGVIMITIVTIILLKIILKKCGLL